MDRCVQVWSRAKALNINNAIQSNKANCYSSHQRNTRHDAHTGMHTHSAIRWRHSLQPNATATVRLVRILMGTQQHTEHHQEHSDAHTTHSTHLRPALALGLEPSSIPLETCHPAQFACIVDGLINTSPVTPYTQQVQGTHLVLCIHICTHRDQLHSRPRLLVADGSMKSSSSTLSIAFNRYVN